MCVPHNQENWPLPLFTWTLEEVLRPRRVSASSGSTPDFCGHSSHRGEMCVACDRFAARLVNPDVFNQGLVGEAGSTAASVHIC